MNSPIFSPEDDDLSLMRWSLNGAGYATKGNKVAHHYVCERAFGRKPDWSKKECCDHINRNKLDNRRENLRIVSIAENNRNKPAKFVTGRADITSEQYRAIRLSLGMTQEQLAKILNVSKRQINYRESGRAITKEAGLALEYLLRLRERRAERRAKRPEIAIKCLAGHAS